MQFTSDLLPADIIGVSVFDRDTQQFQFRQGPVFTQLLLADEINRASPKAQSALLEAMEERQVSVDGTTYPLPEPVLRGRHAESARAARHLRPARIAARPFPDAREPRLSRRAAERELLLHGERRELLRVHSRRCCTPAELLAAQRAVRAVYVSRSRCSTTCRRWSRSSRAELPLGLSPRAAQGLVRAAQAWALLAGERAVLPEHVQAVLPAVAAHRLERAACQRTQPTAPRLARELIAAVPVPV